MTYNGTFYILEYFVANFTTRKTKNVKIFTMFPQGYVLLQNVADVALCWTNVVML